MLEMLIKRAYKMLERNSEVIQVRILIRSDIGDYEIGVSNCYIDFVKIVNENLKEDVYSDEIERLFKHFRTISFEEIEYPKAEC